MEVGSKAGALRQMLLELLEHPHDIRRMVIMGRICSLGKDGDGVDCLVPQDKQVAEGVLKPLLQDIFSWLWCTDSVACSRASDVAAAEGYSILSSLSFRLFSTVQL